MTGSPPENPIDRDVRALLMFLVPWTAACALVFLLASGFFARWDGQAVSVRPPAGVGQAETPAVWQVLVVEPDGRATEATWPAAVVEGRGLPIDPLAIPPRDVPAERPHTRKARFQLHFLVEDADGWITVPTTSPRSLAVALVLLVIGVGVRNMVWAGSPVAIRRREPATGEPSATAEAQARPGGRRGPPRKQPPPSRPRRGPRR